MNRMHSGFTLTEVLVSVFVLAVGVIGVAGMELNALRTTRQSGFQTTAVALASDIAEKIRTDAASMDEDGSPFLGIDYSSDAGDEDAPEIACFAGSQCNVRQIAQFDIHEWERRLHDSLPAGRARICRDDVPWDAHAYRWECSDTGAIVVKIGWRGGSMDNASGRKGGDFPPAVVLSVGPYAV